MTNDYQAQPTSESGSHLWRGTLLGAPFRPEALEGIVRDALATIAWRGLALELNTRLLSQTPGWGPALTMMLRWFREEGGRRVVVNSDAHRIGQMGQNLDLARAILNDAGLTPTVLGVTSDELRVTS